MAAMELTGTSVLVVDDEVLLRKQIAAQLERLGADVSLAGDLATARGFAGTLNFDFVLLEVNLPDGRGTDLLRANALGSGAGVIVMPAEADVGTAVEALRLGAADFLTKPFETAELPLVFRRVRRSRQSDRVELHRRSEVARNEPAFFFGESLAPLEERINKIIAADVRMGVDEAPPPVLIEGETGTGKTTIARWIHQHGPRAKAPLIEVNCSALPETLAESELFGHERGAFTDAKSARMGLFEAADGGTLFLDELPSLSPGLQAKVLTAIEDRLVRRVGSNKPVAVNVRIIAATNRDLREAVTNGGFREDLLHRLDLFRLSIPPLRARQNDIVRLAERLADQLSRKHRLARKKISDAGRERLLRHPFPGNVRELAHELERAIVFEDGDELEFSHLSRGGGTEFISRGLGSDQWFNEEFRFPQTGFSLEAAINQVIQHALKQTDHNVSAAARLLGVSRDYVRYRLENKH
jgi:DNA-binding NtrC family response regulator